MKTHIELIKNRYSNSKNEFKFELNEVLLSYKVFNQTYFRDKVVLEIGGGFSSYVYLFLNYQAKRVYVSELIPERFNKTLDKEPKVIKIIGNVLEVDFPEKVDVIFMKLTWMFLVPYENLMIKKLESLLNENGILILFEPNYISPISILRRFLDFKNPNPARLFNPLKLINNLSHVGIEKLKFIGMLGVLRVPFYLGTNFWYIGKKGKI